MRVIAEFPVPDDGVCGAPLMQKAPPWAELSLQVEPARQWPKNSHSRRITGIGTPSIHNNNPRPIASSSNHLVEE
ncbi:hypothetical protein BJA5080_04301 [Bradyrhizobium diazoefficiens SEMIA 5080]|uniref:Uncharacterized protein n=1 Tax=Bradyrhizobium diazoefficiens SEMIA 5080 TaxID=754504 RepID=A0A837CKS7_9BRAD|nr:hypothetical protein BJA5080_04301 [Bradyrhizobium diazoefficiens SEMIA 5080]